MFLSKSKLHKGLSKVLFHSRSRSMHGSSPFCPVQLTCKFIKSENGAKEMELAAVCVIALYLEPI